MKPEAFFFDLDGTLVDTEAAWAGAILDFLAEHGEYATEQEIIDSIVGRSWRAIHAYLHETFPKLGDTSLEEDSRSLRRYYSQRVTDPSSQVIKDSVEFLKKVASIAPVAIVSGSPHADVAAAAETCGVSGLIRFILGAEDYPKGKPDPCSYLAAAAKLGVEPSRCVVLEDSEVGVAAGIAAGMKVVELSKSPRGIEGVWKSVRSLSEIDIRKEFA